MRIKREQTIAVAVDYQEKLVPVMHDTKTLIDNTSILLEGLRILDVPVYLTQQYTKGLGSTIEPVTLAAGTKEYLEKLAFSAFESIKWKLRGKVFAVICGIEAHICVLQTVIDLKAAGYVPVLVEDCISSRRAPDKACAVRRAEREGAVITTYEALLFELLGTAGTDTAKQIQRLVK